MLIVYFYLSICVCVLNFADDRRNSNQTFKKRTYSATGFVRNLPALHLLVTRRRSIPVSLFASGIVRISNYRRESMAFLKFFEKYFRLVSRAEWPS